MTSSIAGEQNNNIKQGNKARDILNYIILHGNDPNHPIIPSKQFKGGLTKFLYALRIRAVIKANKWQILDNNNYVLNDSRSAIRERTIPTLE